MTDKALEAAALAAYDADYRVGFWAEWDEIDETEPANARLKNQYRAYAKAAISAYLSALPGEAEVEVRDIFECANQLGGYVGPNTDDGLARFLLRESNAAADLAHEIVRLLGGLQAMQARAEKAERERDEARRDRITAERDAQNMANQLVAAEARVKDLGEERDALRSRIEEQRVNFAGLQAVQDALNLILPQAKGGSNG